MNPQATTDDGWQAKWNGEWPAAQVGSLSLVRLLALPAPGTPPADDSTKWHLTLGQASGDRVVIVSEIVRIVDRFFISIAAQASIRLHADRKLSTDLDDNALDAVLQLYGPWVSHALWDYSRPFLLQATSGLALQGPVDVPVSTPEPTLMTKDLLEQQARMREPKHSKKAE